MGRPSEVPADSKAFLVYSTMRFDMNSISPSWVNALIRRSISPGPIAYLRICKISVYASSSLLAGPFMPSNAISMRESRVLIQFSRDGFLAVIS